MARSLTLFGGEIENLDRSTPKGAGKASNSLISRIETTYQEQFDFLVKCIAVFQAQAGDLAPFEQAMADAVTFMRNAKDQSQTELDDIKKSIATGTEELNKSIEVARRAAEMNALSSYSTYFSSEATAHKHAAWGWLVATSVLFGGTICLARWF